MTARQVERGEKKRRPHKEKRRDKQETQECRVPVEHCAELLKAD